MEQTKPYSELTLKTRLLESDYLTVSKKILATKYILLLICSIGFFGSLPANNYTPNTFTDPVITTLNNATGEINGGATISLRSSLMAADNLGGTHLVTLSSGTYNLTQPIPDRQITLGNTSQNITISGNGPANTIINMTNDANRDRIFFINPVGTTNNVITVFQNMTIQNGYLSSDPYGGAGICAGGGSGNALTVTNCMSSPEIGLQKTNQKNGQTGNREKDVYRRI